MTTAAVIVAAGRGIRAGGNVPKQYRSIGSVPVLRHALQAFAGHPLVGPVQTVIRMEDCDLFDAAADRLDVLPPVAGGETRQASVRAGLEALVTARPERVLIHDAARPFVTGDLISRVIGALDAAPGAVPGLAVVDTLKRADNGRVGATVDRTGLWMAQTPQGFRFDAILDAHRRAHGAGEESLTDDAAVAEWAGLEVVLVEGDSDNVKLTTPQDLEQAEERMAEAAFAAVPDVRLGHGFDVHAFAPGDHVMLCGVRIPHEAALKGHSDADVGLHALTDAIYGALGDGDIGTHFPPTDPRWAGAASHIFLAAAADAVVARGGLIAPVDVTLVCEVPRIGPHAAAMRQRIADILAIAPGRVSVKATTSEQLGFTGRREGIAAYATATIRLPLS